MSTSTAKRFERSNPFEKLADYHCSIFESIRTNINFSDINHPDLLDLYENFIKESIPESHDKGAIYPYVEIVTEDLLCAYVNEERHCIEEIFVHEIIQTLFDVSVLYCLDFNRIYDHFYDALYDIAFDCSIPEISFWDFTNLSRDCIVGYPNDGASAHVPKIQSFIETHFKELLEDAVYCDIEALYNFGIRESDVLTVDFGNTLFKLYDDYFSQTECGDIPIVCDFSAVLAISKYYPDILQRAHIAYIEQNIQDAINAHMENDKKSLEYLNDEFLQVIDSIVDQKNYHSEDFILLSEHWKYMLDKVLLFYDGATLTAFIKCLTHSFGVSKDEIRDTIYCHLSNIYGDSTNFVAHAIDIARIEELLSNQLVYKYISEVKPSILDALS